MKFFIPLVMLFFVLSCAKEQPKVAWLKIDKWELGVHPDAVMPQGEPSHNLSQVFLNVNGKSLGIYELPAKIPIIAEDGEYEIVLIPGVVANDGMIATKDRYPFAEHYTSTIYLKQNDTVSLTPTTRYFSNLNFLIEDFESPSMQLDVAEESLATIGRNNNPNILIWGNNYGEINLTTTDSTIAFMTTFETVLPKFGTDVYLEFDYMNTNSMLTSVISYGNNEFHTDPFLFATPQEENDVKWKHAYYNLKKVVSLRQSAPINEIQFHLILDDLLEESYLYIDNIKIIYP